jgi:hypothetical protein
VDILTFGILWYIVEEKGGVCVLNDSKYWPEIYAEKKRKENDARYEGIAIGILLTVFLAPFIILLGK